MIDKLVRPEFLLILLAFAFFIFYRRKSKTHINTPTAGILKASKVNIFISNLLRIIKILSLIVLITSLVIIVCKPLKYVPSHWKEKMARKICLTVDVSMSMTGEGIKRMKEIIDDFIQRRAGDYLAITAYSGHNGYEGGAGIVRPLTSYLPMVRKAIKKDVKPKMFGVYTDLGEGVWVSIRALLEDEVIYLNKKKGAKLDWQRLRIAIKSPEQKENKNYIDYFVKRIGQKKNCAVILFSDGIYNTGMYPLLPIGLGKQFGIMFHFVFLRPSSATGVGEDEGMRRMREVRDAVLDAGGKYYEGVNYDQIADFYRQIDASEKDIIKIREIERLEDNCIFFALIAVFAAIAIYILEKIWPKVS